MRLSIRAKLLGGALLLVAFSAAIAAVAIDRLGHVRDTGDALYTQGYEPVVASSTIQTAAKDMALQGATYNLLAATLGPAKAVETPQGKQVVPAIEADQKAIKGALPKLAQAPGAMQDTAQQIGKAANDYSVALGKILQAPEGSPIASELEQDINDALTRLNTSAARFTTQGDEYAQAAAEDIESSYTQARTIVLGTLLAAILFGIAGALVLSGSIRRGVASIRERLTSLQERDTASLRRDRA